MFDVCCRMCLENVPLSDIQSLYDRHNNFTIRDKIYELFQIKFSDTEKLSTVCNSCLQKIETADSIRKFFLQANDKFKNILGCEKETAAPPEAHAEHCTEQIYEEEEQPPEAENTPDETQKTVKLEPQDSTANILELRVLEDIPASQEEEFDEHVVYIEEALDELSNSSPHTEVSVYEEEEVTTLVYKSHEGEDNMPEAEVDFSIGIESEDELPNTMQVDEPESNEINEDVEEDSGDRKKISETLEEEFSIITVEFQCNVCHEMFEDRGAFTAHTKNHSSEYPVSCDHCLMLFKANRDLKAHNCAEKPRPFPCSDCSDRFATVKNLRIHTRDEHRPAFCKHCRRKFATFKDFKVHNCAERRRMLPCSECTDLFFSIVDLRAHTKSKHPEANRRPPAPDNKAPTHKCYFCPSSYLSKATLTKHVEAAHSNPATYPCDQCEKTFSTAHSARAHATTHDKKYECSFCGKLCPTAVSLAGHENTHTKERPFECCVCTQSFAQYTGMRRHMKIHQDDKAYSCDFCPKSFRQRSVMLTHRRIHTGEKPFTCAVCSKKFRDHSTFAKHRKLHERKKKRSSESSSPGD